MTVMVMLKLQCTPVLSVFVRKLVHLAGIFDVGPTNQQTLGNVLSKFRVNLFWENHTGFIFQIVSEAG